jgi:hypothetical protein
MTAWTAIVIIVAILAGTALIRAKHRARAGITVDHMGGEQIIQQQNDDLRREVEELRERVKVLERIATEDRGARAIADEIESLRGK